MMPRAGDAGEAFIKRWWRPAMAVQYMLVCVFDFVIFPAVYTTIYSDGGSFHEWKSLTLQGGGLYHAAMGAIVGTYVWQRGQEVMANMGGGSRSVVERTVERSSVVTPASRQGELDGQPAGKSSRAD